MLDPEMKAVLDEIDAWPTHRPLTPENIWVARVDCHRHAVFAPPYEEVADVTDHVVEGREGPIRVRMFVPAAAVGAETPGLLCIHGGGMVAGSPDGEDRISRMLANALGCRVLAVAYRLAPEHPWPAGLHDCLDALVCLHAEAASLGVDGDRIAVFGHSAGGLLTLSCALALREGTLRVRRYVALEPTTDVSVEGASQVEHDPDSLFADEMDACWAMYLHGTPQPGALAIPALATDEELRGLDPVAILTAECDPLRDQGEAFAARLAAAGVDVESRRFDGLAHGSIAYMGRVPRARPVFDEIVRLLRGAFDAG